MLWVLIIGLSPWNAYLIGIVEMAERFSYFVSGLFSQPVDCFLSVELVIK